MEQKENDAVESSDRSQVAAGVLAIFLGWIGVHRFYIGKPGTAILMMLGTGLGVILLMIGLWERWPALAMPWKATSLRRMRRLPPSALSAY